MTAPEHNDMGILYSSVSLEASQVHMPYDSFLLIFEQFFLSEIQNDVFFSKLVYNFLKPCGLCLYCQ